MIKRLLLSLVLALAFSVQAQAVTHWSISGATCGTSPTASLTSDTMTDGTQFLKISGNTGSGTVTSCVINLATDCTVAFNPGGTPSCLPIDLTDNTVLTPTFSNTNVGTCAYGTVTLTHSGGSNFASHNILMECWR